MDLKEYQAACLRTESDPWESRERIYAEYRVGDDAVLAVRVNHAILGLASEVGELASAVKKWLYLGQGEINRLEIKEELGDALWYAALLCEVLGLSLQDVMESNIRKLQVRYPERFSAEKAAQENRDIEREKKSLEDSRGFTGTLASIQKIMETVEDKKEKERQSS